MAAAQCTTTLTLPECIDVLEAHPHHPTLLAVCTYMLHASGRKTGSVGLLRYATPAAASAPTLALTSPPLATSAVFDGHWCPSSSAGDGATPLFLAATQGPSLGLHALAGMDAGCAGAGAGPSLCELGTWTLPCSASEGSAASAAPSSTPQSSSTPQ